MFSKIIVALCAISLANAEYSAKQKEELSVKVIQIQRSVDFLVKISKIELEMQVYGVQAEEINTATDDAAKDCIKGVTEKAVENQGEVLDSTVGKATPEIDSMYKVIMSDSPQDSDWDQVNTFISSFNLDQYKKEAKNEFMSKLQAWLNLQKGDMQSCLKQ